MAQAAAVLDGAAQSDAENTAHFVKHVTFSLAEETYAVAAASVNEVLRYTDITPVPGAPAYVLGIINLRGDVVTVVDGRGVFGLGTGEINEQTRIVVVEIEDFIVGILVDRVAAVVDLQEELMESSPNTGNDMSTRFINGVYNEDDRLYILVDFSQLTAL